MVIKKRPASLKIINLGIFPQGQDTEVVASIYHMLAGNVTQVVMKESWRQLRFDTVS